MSHNKIVFVTGNANKLKEVQLLLKGIKYELVNEPLDLDELQESKLESIAISKVKQATSQLGAGVPVFVEDTALCFNAMNGLPGAYIKWFVKEMGIDNIYKMLTGFEDKTAKAITTIAYSDAMGKIHVFQGITEGTIVEPQGPRTFGWDSLFKPNDGVGLTYAQMDKEEKNKISQRARAFFKLKEYLEQQ
ncbi:probable Inosine triphosphate pyrophosphatase [Saccharomycodes ludwigii]|uniref:Inosine triphosphate pyrophosphatase n=1 Tax=Saccharomycodes ludwigii TaxID=36035 RepID=A0A376BA82_9ASCO|nr:hypothetical protein SCDLUD_000415 [Saccharomycodes ludwigii]KAH3902823.1 hypothetical protein SCDLUD_000415 [Saccharomycodes ludwigii]SSD61489.1 probable Inosine triphosphate pyrophosphatase [Saccharomycodes ludwigii]